MIQKFLSTLLICAFVQIGSVFFAFSVQAQSSSERSTSELGIGIGGVNYKGEVAPQYRFLSNRPALMIFYKKDISKPIALRGSLLAGRVVAKDQWYAKQPLAVDRNAIVRTSLLELAGGIDYNFLNYYDFRRHTRWTPYFTISVAGTVYNNKTSSSNSAGKFEQGFALTVPIGLGFKYALSHHWNIGAEFGTRVLSTDRFDDYSVNSKDQNNEFYMNPNDRDRYYYTGIQLSYTFYKINCPEFD